MTEIMYFAHAIPNIAHAWSVARAQRQHIAQTGDHPWAPALSSRIPAEGPCQSEVPETLWMDDREVVEPMLKLAFRPRGRYDAA